MKPLDVIIVSCPKCKKEWSIYRSCNITCHCGDSFRAVVLKHGADKYVIEAVKK